MFCGCGGTTAVYMPDRLHPPSELMSRIVVTREKQMAGMTTPLYIVDTSDGIEVNAVMQVRVGDWKPKETLQLFYSPGYGFLLGPMRSTGFEETDVKLGDLIADNKDAVVYVDYLRCDPGKVRSLYCGNGKDGCDEPFTADLISREGLILGDTAAGETLEEGSRKDVRKVRVVGRIGTGDTIAWDRPAGILRFGAIWGSSNKNDNTLDLIPANIVAEPGKTYYFTYRTNLGERWKVTSVEQGNEEQ